MKILTNPQLINNKTNTLTQEPVHVIKKRGRTKLNIVNPLVDVRGYLVYDKFNKKVGFVSDIYIDIYLFKPRYLQITPLNSILSKIYKNKDLFYPWSNIIAIKDSGIHIDNSFKELIDSSIYDLEHVMILEKAELMTYDEAVDLEREDEENMSYMLPNWSFV